MNRKVQSYIDQKYEVIAAEKKCIDVLEKIVGLKLPEVSSIMSYVLWGTRDKVVVCLHPLAPEDATTLALAIGSALGVRKFNKSFNGYSGMAELVGEAPKIRIEVSATPVLCKVTKVEEVVTVPEHTETQTRYVIENPEECGASGIIGEA